ncbi:hypothetical protein [Lentibacillus jeotgali]|uniref:hypothetical protein n=1 Tax=Lentibacillus jeotgali TaxID=558169 RepID=UPI0002627483|nr:hypothetical protein [Lentibacillus jeotgali]
MLLNKFSEKDFAVLRRTFESGRQSPSSMSGMLILAVILQSLMFFLIYVVAADRSYFPNKESIFVIHLGITLLLMILSIVYAVPSIYMKQQKAQYLIIILVSQNLFGLLLYIGALFFLGKNQNISVQSLLLFSSITLIFGLLVFIITAVRFFLLLKKGHYREGSRKDESRRKFEKNSYIPIVTVGSLGLVYIIQYLIRTFDFIFDLEIFVMVLLGVGLFYAMLFVLPEQLVILYCKYRFESFNFSKDGNLQPFGIDRKDA